MTDFTDFMPIIILVLNAFLLVVIVIAIIVGVKLGKKWLDNRTQSKDSTKDLERRIEILEQEIKNIKK
ncbi:hypothetical protein [Virgibacillus halodenitrificans]|uniref:DUF4083 domain-containing protein n=1 Tax=Virgibacillus halodenitrificans TaxID=1482 RepID=A0AAC9IZX8_VIRHA|nr:hypothetical protein [Virgibacillus halodenitrificans]APC48841.1 hypothetical protein BME96_11835 [Virgibacillus halodenitrificans]MBD1221899.1 hypothetical protein [Virgibacillus halodenitrificans]